MAAVNVAAVWADPNRGRGKVLIRRVSDAAIICVVKKNGWVITTGGLGLFPPLSIEVLKSHGSCFVSAVPAIKPDRGSGVGYWIVTPIYYPWVIHT